MREKQMFIYKNTHFIEVIRAISDLKYGIPVVLHNGSKRILVISVERASEELFTKLKILLPGMYLTITKQRASFLLKDTCDNNCKISCENMNYDDVQKMVFALSFRKNSRKFINNTELEDKALILMKSAELIPAAFISEIHPNLKMDFSVNDLNVDYINDYLSHADDKLKEMCSADLNLKLAKGEIKAFRSEFSKDHYAVIIHPKKQNSAIPFVRVHSSCFTGDLLASIKCDCFDQLQNAIKIMSEKGGGIILYLNQEGRGIGLTNKIRVYKTQSLKFDTVEANENLGLEGDSRGFFIAAKILKLLGISRIKLLSNNPAKVEDLIKEGIAVESIISHQFFNKKIKKYYRAKAQKFNHNIDY